MENNLLDTRIDALLRKDPSLSRVFETLGLDYCCSGAQTLGQACLAKGLDLGKVGAILAKHAGASANSNPASGPASGLGLAELADHIEEVHHAFLRREIPRLLAITEKVARVHGASDPRLVGIRDAFRSLAEELAAHLEKEERVLFPALRRLDKEGGLSGFNCGTLAGPINVMHADHEDASAALARISELADGYQPPDWACNTYQAMLDGLKEFEADLAEHVRKEEMLLFPRALEQEGHGSARR
jgi:regulator of cell morphogenesis and NO signaling